MLHPLLKAIRGEDGGAWLPSSAHRAVERIASRASSAKDLRTAGVHAPRLWAKTATHLPVDFRCLRDTYATGQALAGLDIHKLMRRTGPEDYATKLRYAKIAESVALTVGLPFGPLPSGLCVTASVIEPERVGKLGWRRGESTFGGICPH